MNETHTCKKHRSTHQRFMLFEAPWPPPVSWGFECPSCVVATSQTCPCGSVAWTDPTFSANAFLCCGLVLLFFFCFLCSAPRWSDDRYPSSIDTLPLFKSPTVWIYPLRKLLRQIHRQRLKAIPRVEIEAVLVVQKRQEQRDMPSVPTRTAEGKTTELVEPVAQGPHARADAARLR